MVTSPKDPIQASARRSWDLTRKGTLAMATGTGKSKIAVDRVKDLFKEKPGAKVLLVVPTTRLRDNNWKDEFTKWKAASLWDKVHRSCYISVVKLDLTAWDLVVLDEAHNITENNSQFFVNNHVREVMGLTATPPRDPEKYDLLKLYAPICFVYTMDEAVTDGLVVPYDITIYSVFLDQHDKYIKGGSKDKSFMTTEFAQYQYLTKRISQAMYQNESSQKFSRIARMGFMKKLRSKTEAAMALLTASDEDEKIIVFCGSIDQAEHLLPGQTYHSKSDDKALNAFMKGKINRLACVDALNEGINVPLIDRAIIVSFNSNSKNMIQRIGRVVRLRDDHVAKIDIIVVQGTVDEDWSNKALADFDASKISYQDIRNVTKVSA